MHVSLRAPERQPQSHMRKVEIHSPRHYISHLGRDKDFAGLLVTSWKTKVALVSRRAENSACLHKKVR